MKILFIGDVVSEIGCKAVRKMLPEIKDRFGELDFIIANAENSAVGNGVSKESAQYLLDSGCDLLTGGNHSFRNFSIHRVLAKSSKILRPLNLTKTAPGKGFVVLEGEKGRLAVVNLMGQAFLDTAISPFEEIKRVLLRLDVKNILIDFHAEATGEKAALANFLDGKVSAVVGTHTHVQTNDARILKNGTGFITDVGMVGPYDSILGVIPRLIVRRILTKMPTKFEVEQEGVCVFSAVFLELDNITGGCTKIESVYEKCEI